MANADRGSGNATSSVRVAIRGEDYTIRSDAPPAHTRAVAEHVDRVLQDVLRSGAVVETHKAAILAALQITDELFRARAETRELAARIEALGAEVKRWLPPTKRDDGRSESPD